MPTGATAVGDEGTGGNSFEAGRRSVDAFVATSFSWRGTLLLHRHALGWDLLRAPVNVALAPVHLFVRLLAAALGLLRWRGAAAWLEGRLSAITLQTALGRHIEYRIAAELLNLPLWQDGPAERTTPRTDAGGDEAGMRMARARRTLKSYSATRSAVAEITTALIALLVGALLFRSLTPGMASMAPSVAEAIVRDAAIAGFPLGRTLGAAWYGVFPTGASATQVIRALVALMAAASLVTTFSGLIADPIQARLRIHQRRLHRVIDALESELVGASPRSFTAREHYYARIADLFDAVSALSRHLR